MCVKTNDRTKAIPYEALALHFHFIESWRGSPPTMQALLNMLSSQAPDDVEMEATADREPTFRSKQPVHFSADAGSVVHYR